jgi:hypothetical protein
VTPATSYPTLQAVVDDIRVELKKGMGCYTRIEHPRLPAPIWLEVIPDGITWLVAIECDGRSFTQHSPTETYQAVDPDEFTSNLYVILVAVIRSYTKPKAKPS